MSGKTKFNRRQFLILAAGAVGGTIVTCGGATALALRQPPIEFIQSNCGKGEHVGDKVLIAYASKCGSTGEIAESIGQVLCERGASVDVRRVQDVTDVSGYGSVIVGSAVRVGQCLPEAKAFVEKHSEALAQKSLAYFIVCLSIKEEDEEQRNAAQSYADPLKTIVEPDAEGIFAGVMDYKKLPFLMQIMIRFMKSCMICKMIRRKSRIRLKIRHMRIFSNNCGNGAMR